VVGIGQSREWLEEEEDSSSIMASALCFLLFAHSALAWFVTGWLAASLYGAFLVSASLAMFEAGRSALLLS